MEPERQPFLVHSLGKSSRGLSLADAVFTVTIVLWGVVGTWRGCFIIFQSFDKPYAIFWIGCFCEVIFVYGRTFLCPKAFIGRITYIYLFMLCIVAHWAAIWTIFDQIIGNELLPNLCAVLVGFVLMLIKALRNILAPPYVGTVDSSAGAYMFPTFFRTRKRSVSLWKFNWLRSSYVYDARIHVHLQLKAL